MRELTVESVAASGPTRVRPAQKDAVGRLADEFHGKVEDAARENAEEGHSDHEKAADDGPDQHGAVEFVTLPIGEAAHRRVWQRDRPEADEEPRGEKQSPR